jgi:hypothetical protein
MCCEVIRGRSDVGFRKKLKLRKNGAALKSRNKSRWLGSTRVLVGTAVLTPKIVLISETLTSALVAVPLQTPFNTGESIAFIYSFPHQLPAGQTINPDMTSIHQRLNLTCIDQKTWSVNILVSKFSQSPAADSIPRLPNVHNTTTMSRLLRAGGDSALKRFFKVSSRGKKRVCKRVGWLALVGF